MSDKTLDDVISMLEAERIGMLVTHDDERLVARPMGLQHVDENDHSLWFFIESSSDKADQVQDDAQVNVSFAGDNYVSVSGTASVVRDPAKNEELWNPFAKSWLQCEPTDPKVALLKVVPDTLAYWETPSSPRYLLGVAKSLVGGDRPQGGDSGVVQA